MDAETSREERKKRGPKETHVNRMPRTRKRVARGEGEGEKETRLSFSQTAATRAAIPAAATPIAAVTPFANDDGPAPLEAPEAAAFAADPVAAAERLADDDDADEGAALALLVVEVTDDDVDEADDADEAPDAAADVEVERVGVVVTPCSLPSATAAACTAWHDVVEEVSSVLRQLVRTRVRQARETDESAEPFLARSEPWESGPDLGLTRRLRGSKGRWRRPDQCRRSSRSPCCC